MKIVHGVTIQAHERIDDLHRKGRLLIQDPGRFCFGTDAVLLSGFAKAGTGARTVDLCTGTGVIPILMEAKNPGAAYFAGIELQEESADMAKRSVALNGLSNVEIFHGNIKEWRKYCKPSDFDVVTANPPYMPPGKGILGEVSAKAAARHEIYCTLEDVVKTAALLLRTGGRFYMVHRPQRLCDIIWVMRQEKLEPKTLRFVHSRKEKEPELLLIEGVRSGGAFLKVLPPLVIYNESGEYTEEAMGIYYE